MSKNVAHPTRLPGTMPRNVQALNRLAFTTNVMMSASAADEEEAAVDQATESPLANMRDATAEADYVVSEHLPGPLADKSREEVLAEIAAAGGQSHVQWMEWQEQYGDETRILVLRMQKDPENIRQPPVFADVIIVWNPLVEAHLFRMPPGARDARA